MADTAPLILMAEHGPKEIPLRCRPACSLELWGGQRPKPESLRARSRMKLPLEAALAACMGFNLALALAIVIYIGSLRVDPNNFKWLQPKDKARPPPTGHVQHLTVPYGWNIPSEPLHVCVEGGGCQVDGILVHGRRNTVWRRFLIRSLRLQLSGLCGTPLLCR